MRTFYYQPKRGHTAVAVIITGDSPALQHYTMGILLCWTAATMLAVAPLFGWGRSAHCLSLYCLHMLHGFVQSTISAEITCICCTALFSPSFQLKSLAYAAQLCSVHHFS